MSWNRALLVAFTLLGAARLQAAPNAQCALGFAYKSGTVLASPAYVHVDCTATTDSNASVRPFHDLDYQIDYGDTGASGAGFWAFGAGRASKNSDNSPIGAHVYETAGTYTVDVIVTDSAGTASTWSGTFTVVSEDAGWPAADTRCVSTSGNFSGCPSGVTNLVTSSDYDAQVQVAAGKRTLFRCGESFVASSDPIVNDGTANGVLIGGYGSCSGNPVQVSTPTDLHFANGGMTLAGLRLRDITYTANGGGTVSIAGAADGDRSRSKFLVLRVRTLGVSFCGGTMAMTSRIDTWNDLNGAFAYECQSTRFSSGGAWPEALASSGRSAIVGSRYSNEITSGTNGWRANSWRKSLFAHNTYRGLASGNRTIHFRICAPDCATRVDEFNVFRENLIWDDSPESLRSLVISSDTGTDTTGRQRDWIVDSNRFSYGGRVARSAPNAIQLRGVQRATIRNNVIDYRGVNSSSSVSGILAIPTATTSDDVGAYNNTVIGRSGSIAAVDLAGGSLHRGRNNLVYLVSGSNGRAVCSTPSGGCTNNVSLSGSIEGCPFAGRDDACTLSTPSESFDFAEFKLRSSGGSRATLVGAGFTFPDTSTAGRRAFVFKDAFGGCRGSAVGGPDSAWDIGAHEAGSVVCVSDGGTPGTPPLEAPVLLP